MTFIFQICKTGKIKHIDIHIVNNELFDIQQQFGQFSFLYETQEIYNENKIEDLLSLKELMC